MSRRKPVNKPRTTKPREYLAAGPLPVPVEMLTAGAPLDADVEMDRQKRMEALKQELMAAISAGRGAEAVDQVLVAMTSLERDVERMGWQVLRANRYRFGRRSEKLSRDELRQLALALGSDEDSAKGESPSVPAPAEPEQVEDAPVSSDAPPDNQEGSNNKRKKRQRVRSMKIASHVERKVTEVKVPAEERNCAFCGLEMKSFGHVDHERIRYVPAKIVVDVERREKLGCTCREDMAVAPRTQAPAVVRKVDASMIGKLLAQKTVMGLPVDRQRRELARLGVDIPDKTLQSYWSYGSDLVEPVAIATLSLVFGKSIVGADDSHLRTLDKAAKHGVFRGHLWCFVGTDGVLGEKEMVGYGYTPSWEADEIAEWFSAIDGHIQCDGYAGYSTELEDEDGQLRVPVPDDRRLGCGMHIRSKFHAALEARDRRAAIPIQLIADLYQVEDDCKKLGLNAEQRGEHRKKRSVPILKALDEWVDETHPKLLPKSPLRIATTYARSQRVFFWRCFSDGRFEIDNGRVERRIRMYAVARRNFLFTGSVRGGERLAAVFTLVDNCLTLGIDPYEYLVDIIDRLERGWPLRQLSALIPCNWAAEKAAQHSAQ